MADRQPGCDGEHVAAIVPTARLAPGWLRAGIDDAKPVDAHCLSGRLEERLCPGHLESIIAAGDRMRGQRVCDRRLHHDGIGVDNGAKRVELTGRAVPTGRHGEHCVHQASVEEPACKSFGPCGRRMVPDTDCYHSGRQEEHVTAIQMLKSGVIDPASRTEPRVVPVDHGCQVCFPPSPLTGQARDSHMVTDPEA